MPDIGSEDALVDVTIGTVGTYTGTVDPSPAGRGVEPFSWLRLA